MGNSYGQMDGGVDRALANHWPGVQRAVWAAIADNHHGYLPVGSATITRLATPGFGTGYGRVPPHRAAHLMATAHTMHRLPPTTQISHRESLLQHS